MDDKRGEPRQATSQAVDANKAHCCKTDPVTGAPTVRASLFITLVLMGLSIAQLVIVFVFRTTQDILMSTSWHMISSYLYVICFYMWLYGHVLVTIFRNFCSSKEEKAAADKRLVFSRWALAIILISYTVSVVETFLTMPYREPSYASD